MARHPRHDAAPRGRIALHGSRGGGAQGITGRTRGISYDRELLLCASFLHDSGLYDTANTGDVYINDSARYARRTLEPFGWPEKRLRVCLDACEQHHAFTTRWWMATEVELVRRSDLVEVYPELRRFGIPRSWLKRGRMLPGMFRPPGPGEEMT